MFSEAQGLTKREAFAMAAMQGILAGRTFKYFGLEPLADVTEWSMKYADELLKQLES